MYAQDCGRLIRKAPMVCSPPIRVDCIVGARPNFVKMAPILAAFATHGGYQARLIHTGQHYDLEMNAVFFQQLGLPEPDLNLEVGSGSQTAQTAHIMLGLEQAFLTGNPDLVLVVGDVNSTLAAALVSAKLRIPLAHVEAGLRSFDMAMPEEINRIVTDRLSDLLFTTERAAERQLVSEGISPDAVHFVGNVMIDTLLANAEKAIPVEQTLQSRGIPSSAVSASAEGFVLATLHRPSNVDDPRQLGALLDVLGETARSIPVLFTMHPRTKAQIVSSGLDDKISVPGFTPLPPLSYFEMLGAMQAARVVVTDSGGLQDETTALGIDCLTVRDSTERPVTIEQGTSTLVGSSPAALHRALQEALASRRSAHRMPELWDGRAAHRIAAVIAQWHAMPPAPRP